MTRRRAVAVLLASATASLLRVGLGELSDLALKAPAGAAGLVLVPYLEGERTPNRPGARDGHAMFDLAGYIAARLKRAGVGRIEDLGHCTYADPGRFFSYRRSTHRAEADYGRHISAIALME